MDKRNAYINRQIQTMNENNQMLKGIDERFMKAELCLKRTSDDWHPNYNGNQVILKFHSCINVYDYKLFKFKSRKCRKVKKLSTKGQLEFDQLTWRVSIWGADDLGIDRDFNDQMEAKNFYNEIKKIKVISRDEMLNNYGFNYF